MSTWYCFFLHKKYSWAVDHAVKKYSWAVDHEVFFCTNYSWAVDHGLCFVIITRGLYIVHGSLVPRLPQHVLAKINAHKNKREKLFLRVHVGEAGNEATVF